MQKIEYAELRKLTTEQIVALTSSQNPFVVITDPTKGAQIAQFLKSDEIFQLERKSLRSRFQYLRAASVGFFLLDFLHLWVASVNNGYEVTAIRQADVFEIRFCR